MTAVIVLVACAVLVVCVAALGALHLVHVSAVAGVLLDAAASTPWPEDEADDRLLSSLRAHVRAASVSVESQPVRGALCEPVAHDRWVVVRRGVLPIRRTDARLVTGLAAIARASHDTSEREARLRHDAVTDPLTGLWDYTHWFSIFTQESAQRAVGSHVAVVFLDLNRFKQLNSEHGHLRADDVLAALGDRLSGFPGWTFARFGGDEFVGFTRTVRSDEHLHQLCRDLARRIEQPVATEGRTITVSASIGRVLSTSKFDAADRLVARAESDMRLRKTNSRPAMSGRASDHELVRGLLEGGLDVAFQPVVDLRDRTTHGWEALLRSNVPYGGPMGPVDLVAAAARVGALDHLTRTIAERALDTVDAAVWRTGRELHVSVNLEMEQLRWDSALLDWLTGRVRDDGARLMLEITERALGPQAWSPEHAAVAGELAAHGIGLALDDYGAGLARTDALIQRHWDWVKLDSVLLAGDPRGEVMLAGLVTMLHELGSPVVVEGVETEDQLALASVLGVELAQGHLFGRAIAADRLLGELS